MAALARQVGFPLAPSPQGDVLTAGMCLGGHLAFRAAFDPRVLAAVCFFGTDIHSETLGKGKKSDSLKRCKEIKGELVMIFGKKVRNPQPNATQLPCLTTLRGSSPQMHSMIHCLSVLLLDLFLFRGD